MGTNYFMLTNRCECCGRADELHIGKSSMGWRFTARTYDDPYGDEGPTTWSEWHAALARCDGIRDEYGDEVTLDAFLALVGRKADLRSSEYCSPDGPVDLLAGEFS